MSGNINQSVQVSMFDFQFDQPSFGGMQVRVQDFFKFKLLALIILGYS